MLHIRISYKDCNVKCAAAASRWPKHDEIHRENMSIKTFQKDTHTHTHTPKKTPCRQYTQVIQHHWTLARMMSKGPSNGHYTHSATYSDKDSRQQNAITRFCEMKWRRVQLYFDVLWNLRTWNTVALALSLVHLGSSSEMLQENSRDTFRIPLAIRGGLLDPSIQ